MIKASFQCALWLRQATYAVTKEDPVKVGGGATSVAARERSYLNALRGPAGQAIRFKRSGSLPGPNKAILDHYEVTYDGLDKPVGVYLDAYRWSTPMAPQGFVCGTPIGLNPPPPDPFQAVDNLAELAVEFGATGELPPLPLDSREQATHGVVFDRFRRIAQVTKAAAAGKPLDPDNLPNGVSTMPTVVVAYPLTCDGRTIAPEGIDVVNAQGRSAPRPGQYARTVRPSPPASLTDRGHESMRDVSGSGVRPQR